MMTANNKYSFCIEYSHPCFLGHFPSNPIVPGAVILEQVMIAWHEWDENYEHKKIVQKRIRGFDYSKFLKPLQPDIKCSIGFANVNIKKNNQTSEMVYKTDFIVSTGINTTICKGRLVYEQH
jgi:3-hydroxymyristoyl/3-hydroxydecanoyl-(acyl carrier protein) dehydratase